ncbi:MAG: hypothetical protein HYV03_05930 [Deltaproteobacteria bacterium]|nr:hypothetical protein [Deltaproteobacteria bacterium]
MRLALTTDPGLTRIPDSNVLFRVTLLDVTIYDNSSHSLGINEETDVIANNEAVGPADNSHVTVLAAEWQIPFFERNFFEIGATYLDDDLLWWKSRALFIILPTNVHTGFNWQFQGTPITVSDRVLDVTGMSHILSSYTMLGVRADFSAVHTFSDAKGAEFCNRVSENCENHKIGPEGDRSLQIGDNRFFPNSSGLSQIDPVGHRPYKFQLALQAHLFGEQRWHWGAVVYRGYADYYPTWKKTETAGEASIHVNLGQAMEFYVEGRGRWLHSLREDQDILLPDSGFEYGFNTGLALRPSRFF